MLRRVAGDTLIYGAGTAVSAGLGFLLLPIYTRLFSPTEYGIVDIVAVVAAVVNLVVALEISQAVARFYADADSPGEKTAYASTGLWFTLATYGFFAIAALTFSAELSRLVFGTGAASRVFVVAVVAMVAQGIFYFLQNQLRWQLQPTHFALSSVILAVCTSLVSVGLVLAFGLGVIAVFWGQLTGALVGSAFSWYFARNSFGAVFDVQKLWAMLGYSAPLVPSGIAVFVALYVDRVALRHLMTLGDIGVYGVGYRLALVVGLLLVGVQGALTPRIFANYRRAGAARELATIFRYFLVAVIPALLVLAIFARDAVALLTPAEYHAAYRVIPLLALSVLLSNMYVFAPGLGIAKKTGYIAGISVTAGAVNTVLNFVLIPIWGIVGAAAATCTGALLGFVLYMGFSQRLYPVPHAWRSIALASAACVLLGVAGFLLPGNVGFPTPLLLVSKIALATAGALVTAWLLVDRQELRALLHGVRMRFC